jgi:hypothetical protein
MNLTKQIISIDAEKAWTSFNLHSDKKRNKNIFNKQRREVIT